LAGALTALVQRSLNGSPQAGLQSDLRLELKINSSAK
jgi:hypothetical protein